MPDAMPHYISDKNIRLFTKHNIYTEAEMRARYEIQLESYSKVLNIEALTMVDMARKDFLPAAEAYSRDLARTAELKKELGVDVQLEKNLVEKLSAFAAGICREADALEEALLKAREYTDSLENAKYYQAVIFPAMQELRACVDGLEVITAHKYWPVPSYGDMLFGV